MCAHTTDYCYYHYFLYQFFLLYVTGSEKTWHIVYSMKSELAVLLNSSTFEQLYHRANLPQSLRPIAQQLERFVHDDATPTETKNYSLKAFLCTCIVFPYTREPEIN